MIFIIINPDISDKIKKQAADFFFEKKKHSFRFVSPTKTLSVVQDGWIYFVF